jgi:tetratricopeptide (TPR) repeat protein
MLAQTQPGDKQIRSWIKTLSAKKDPRDSKLGEVIGEIRAIDSSTWCQTMERINTVAQKESTRCQIRVKILWNETKPGGLHCSHEIPAIDNYNAALQAAYEIEDENLQYKIHLTLGQIYNGMGQYGLAAMHFHLFFDILNRNHREDFFLPAGAFYDMSYSLYHTHDYAGCIETGLNGLFALPNARYKPDNALNTYQQMQQWNTIGLAYQKTHHPDSAFLALNHAAQLAKEMKESFWMGIIAGNKGDVYYDMGQYDSAYVLLQYDYNNSIAAHQYDNAANSLQWIARIDLHKGRAKEALQKLYTAQRLLNKLPQPTYQANIDFAFSQVYTELGRADSVNMYLQQYLYLHDSLEAEITKSRTEILEIRLNNLDQIQTIKSLNRQKKQITLTRNFTIALVVLLGCLAFMWLNRLRLKMQIRQREALEGQRIAESEAQKAIEQLGIFRHNLLEKNVLIEKMQTAYESKENTEDENRRLADLSHHLILNEEDWFQFKALFDSVYPGFFLSLRNKVPDITQAEQRMAALSKLKLTVKEAANLTGVSPNTVYKTRQRLRQRLGLEQDSDLDPYFAQRELL